MSFLKGRLDIITGNAAKEKAVFNSGKGYYLETNAGRQKLDRSLDALFSNKCSWAFIRANLPTPIDLALDGKLKFAALPLINTTDVKTPSISPF